MKERRKLLIASDSTLPRLDGISMFLSNIVPRLEKDFDITILAPMFDVKDITLDKSIVGRKFGNVRNIYTKLSPFKAGDYPIPFYPSSKAKEEVRKADIVFVHSIGPVGVTAIHYAKKYRKPTAVYVHSIDVDLWRKSVRYPKFLKDLVKKFARMMMIYAYRRCDYLLLPSLDAKEILEREGISKPMAIVPVGVDTDVFSPPEDKESAKKRLKLSPSRVVIGYVGRIGREKDLSTLIFAFEHLEKKYDNISLILVGTGLVGEVKRSVSSKNIHFAGLRENVVPYLQAMDIFVLPSLTETSSLATIEAMSCGVPVVTTPVGILKTLVRETESGLLFPRGSADSLVNSIEKLILDETLRRKLGKNARLAAKKRFSWKLTSEGIRDALNKL